VKRHKLTRAAGGSRDDKDTVCGSSFIRLTAPSFSFSFPLSFFIALEVPFTFNELFSCRFITELDRETEGLERDIETSSESSGITQRSESSMGWEDDGAGISMDPVGVDVPFR
jgi:hypothetical protein